MSELHAHATEKRIGTVDAKADVRTDQPGTLTPLPRFDSWRVIGLVVCVIAVVIVIAAF